LLDLSDGASVGIIDHLDRSPDWHVVFLDGYYAVYARGDRSNAALVERFGYRTLRGRITAIDLGSCTAERTHDLERDLRLLRDQGASLAGVLEACRPLLTAGRQAPPIAISVATRTLKAAYADGLAPSAVLLACLSATLKGTGDDTGSRLVLTRAVAAFPHDPTLRGVLPGKATPQDENGTW
jgi:hypothetical protein